MKQFWEQRSFKGISNPTPIIKKNIIKILNLTKKECSSYYFWFEMALFDRAEQRFLSIKYIFKDYEDFKDEEFYDHLFKSMFKNFDLKEISRAAFGIIRFNLMEFLNEEQKKTVIKMITKTKSIKKLVDTIVYYPFDKEIRLLMQKRLIELTADIYLYSPDKMDGISDLKKEIKDKFFELMRENFPNDNPLDDYMVLRDVTGHIGGTCLKLKLIQNNITFFEIKYLKTFLNYWILFIEKIRKEFVDTAFSMGRMGARTNYWHFLFFANSKEMTQAYFNAIETDTYEDIENDNWTKEFRVACRKELKLTKEWIELLDKKMLN